MFYLSDFLSLDIFLMISFQFAILTRSILDSRFLKHILYGSQCIKTINRYELLSPHIRNTIHIPTSNVIFIQQLYKTNWLNKQCLVYEHGSWWKDKSVILESQYNYKIQSSTSYHLLHFVRNSEGKKTNRTDWTKVLWYIQVKWDIEIEFFVSSFRISIKCSFEMITSTHSTFPYIPLDLFQKGIINIWCNSFSNVIRLKEATNQSNRISNIHILL